MRTYRQIKIEGGCYFFTVVLAQRQGNNLLIQHIDTLRESFRFKKITTSSPWMRWLFYPITYIVFDNSRKKILIFPLVGV